MYIRPIRYFLKSLIRLSHDAYTSLTAHYNRHRCVTLARVAANRR